MTETMYIPIPVILTDVEFLTIMDLVKKSGWEASQFSEAVRMIIREWREANSQPSAASITPLERRAPSPGE